MLYTNYTRVNEKERDLNKQIDFCILFEISNNSFFGFFEFAFVTLKLVQMYL